MHRFCTVTFDSVEHDIHNKVSETILTKQNADAENESDVMDVDISM